jgi:diguanylate cyclase (GGDEF)-like protein/PAS domain S-box-containing protein
MDQAADNNTDPSSRLGPAHSAATRLNAVEGLLRQLDSEPLSSAALAERAFENRLSQVRLGIASSLFLSLRAKHPPTAAHSLRVAITCSSWAVLQQVSHDDRDVIEMAALLHDIGKIGVPDQILAKPGRLTPEEYQIAERHRQMGAQILQTCCTSEPILGVVGFAGSWFDGSRPGHGLAGEDLPLGARMVAVVDAYDAMTTDQVYRRSLSRERAIAELYEFAGTQFDPRLVKDFCEFIRIDQNKLAEAVCRRWLRELTQEQANAPWGLGSVAAQPSAATGGELLFQQKLLESMHDAVIFVDVARRVTLWNRAAERMTGIAAASVQHKQWSPEMVGLLDDRERKIRDHDCPVLQAITTGVQTFRRLHVMGRANQYVAVDAHLIPVVGRDGVSHGATLLLHDASSEVTLEQRVQSLHERATRDPLTQVANRAEFDRIHSQFVESHLERSLPCSLIMCDIDHFKRINDNYGHQAGDDVLICFGALLARHCRTGDLVARYGGEEFVMLCADCDNATATRRAEEIRMELSQTRQPALKNATITASLGVTELQSGDTPETMLNRADRALYQAKENGRNMVVQLGSGLKGEAAPEKPRGWFASWFGAAPGQRLLERTLVTSVPFKVAAEKLKGFVADHQAEITSLDEKRVVLQIEGASAPLMRRTTDRPVPFLIEVDFVEEPIPENSKSTLSRTFIQVVVRPRKDRDRRRRDAIERANKLLASLKSYLMAQECSAMPETDDSAAKKGSKPAAKKPVSH